MLCCWKPPVHREEKPLIVDLQTLLQRCAWAQFEASCGFFQKLCLRKSQYVFDIPLNFFDFKDIHRELSTKAGRVVFKLSDAELDTEGALLKEPVVNQGLLEGKVAADRDLTTPEYISLDTQFSNDTDQTHTYKFRFEKTRNTEVEVIFQRGVTLGGKANFSISVPIGGPSLESQFEYQVNKSDMQKFTESFLMEASSDICIGPKSTCTAHVVLEERNLHAKFKVVTRMSLANGRAPVYIKRKSDGETVHVYNLTNLPDVFEEVPGVTQVFGENGALLPDRLDFTNEGAVKGSLACNHRIELSNPQTKNS